MGMTFRNLDARTRASVLAEIDRDIADTSLYLSDNLSQNGRADYPALIRKAAQTGSDVTLGQRSLAGSTRTRNRGSSLQGNSRSHPLCGSTPTRC
jgi:hypothetical protein